MAEPNQHWVVFFKLRARLLTNTTQTKSNTGASTSKPTMYYGGWLTPLSASKYRSSSMYPLR